MTPGIYPNLPDADYRKALGLSQSAMKEFARSPQHYAAYITSTTEKETAALRFGKLAHLAILEPELFLSQTVVAPERGRRSNADKEFWAEWEAQNIGKVGVTENELMELGAIANAVRGHKAVAHHIECGDKEVSAWCVDDATGVLCKGRFDVLDNNVIVDIKTTDDASEQGFLKSIAKYRYYLQAAHYSAILSSHMPFADPQFLFVAVEKTAPYGVNVFDMSNELNDKGIELRAVLLERFAECEKRHEWPGYAQEIIQVVLPPWA